jgi:predicted PurR-regulated permease PerM
LSAVKKPAVWRPTNTVPGKQSETAARLDGIRIRNAHIDQEPKRISPVDDSDMPLPSDPKIIFLGGLFAFALLVTAYVAQDIVLPIVAAVVLKLLLQPAIRFLERWRVPRTLAALLVIVVVFGTIIGLGTAISGPAGTWAAKLPEGVPRLQERLSFLKAPIDTLRQFLAQADPRSAHAGDNQDHLRQDQITGSVWTLS